MLFAFHIDPELQHGQAVQRSPGATRQEGQGARVFVHRGGVPAVPEGILWQDGRGEEIKCTDTQKTLQPQWKHRGCVLWINVDISGCWFDFTQLNNRARNFRGKIFVRVQSVLMLPVQTHTDAFREHGIYVLLPRVLPRYVSMLKISYVIS